MNKRMFPNGSVRDALDGKTYGYEVVDFKEIL